MPDTGDHWERRATTGGRPGVPPAYEGWEDYYEERWRCDDPQAEALEADWNIVHEAQWDYQRHHGERFND